MATEHKLRGPARLPPGRRIYAIGDIHGRADLLRRLQGLIEADLEAGPARDPLLILLGDYVDRGPDSAGVLDLLLAPAPARMARLALMGNHEELMLRFLADAATLPVWFVNGGDATLASYGIDPYEGVPDRLRDRLDRALPASHRALLEGLALCHDEGGYFFVHAGIKPGLPLDRQRREDMLWIRGEFLHSKADHGRVVVHGHSIVRRPDIRPNRIGIDTGAFASGHLTCLVLEGEERRFLAT
ncbi:MAG: metallophosphoesterase family protein [Pseudomonadota bacterium]